MKAMVLALLLVATCFASGQQIACAKFDEQQGYNSPKYTMKGCQSFNELQAAGGLKIDEGRWSKPFACFATTFPEEAQDLFIFVSLDGVIDFRDSTGDNGDASMQTFFGGVKLNSGFTSVTWTQYPKENPFLWSEGTWTGHGDAQLMKWSEESKSLVPDPDAKWNVLHIPRLHASIEDDTVTLRLEMNNVDGSVETLKFNRRTGRALLDFSEKEHALRCVPVAEQN
jgi:hypothetical protein